MYMVDLQKGYNSPIVAQAVVNFFLYDKPILETLYECTNILDFCKTQNIGRKYHVEFYTNTCTEIQRNVRYYVSNRGGNLFKVDANGNKNNLCSGYQVNILNTLDDMPISERNINYQYYYNECIKIIDPIKLGINVNQKGGKGIKSGKAAIKKNSGVYGSLFEDNEE